MVSLYQDYVIHNDDKVSQLLVVDEQLWLTDMKVKCVISAIVQPSAQIPPSPGHCLTALHGVPND